MAETSFLIKRLVKEGNTQVVERDVEGNFHFNGNFKNASDLEKALNALVETTYKELVQTEKNLLLEIFEKVFNHKAFTGRSGTFYGYEGLGSIYWHMVSKLLLAAQECCIKAMDEQSSPEVIGRLMAHYYEIKAGIGVHKAPILYGAFPTDPYSHTPGHRGAQQPGMTGQVKEDILVRRAELGVFVNDGKIQFNPGLLQKNEFLEDSEWIEYINVSGKPCKILLDGGTLFFTCCQVPVTYQKSAKKGLKIEFTDGSVKEEDSNYLDKETSLKIFNRTGEIKQIMVSMLEV
jgi:hypothetical protein